MTRVHCWERLRMQKRELRNCAAFRSGLLRCRVCVTAEPTEEALITKSVLLAQVWMVGATLLGILKRYATEVPPHSSCYFGHCLYCTSRIACAASAGGHSP